jgi:hypothetical protein
MCEFKVYLETGEPSGRKEVARNVVAAKRRNSQILLMDAFGAITPVENATIDEANTFTQEMILRIDLKRT